MDSKKSNVASSSIIDLKAELFRKQQEFKQQKLHGETVGYVKSKPIEKKPNIWSKKNAGVLQRSQRDLDAKVEEENVYEKSKKSLEEKAKLYERMTEGSQIPEEDGSKVFLVDFQKKVIDDIVEKREKQRREEEERLTCAEEEILAKTDIPPPASEGEEWVDYVDSFGRSRRCMKKDLPKLEKQDKMMLNDNVKNKEKEDDQSLQLLSNDMRREMLRQKWEEEEKAAMNQPIHYSNVQFDEIRTHGVGFYQFAKDESTRQEQLDTLTDIRNKTKEGRDRKERIKNKRKAIMEARLAKVKQRKLEREGGGLFGSDSHQVLSDEDDVIGPKLEENSKEKEGTAIQKKEPGLLIRDESLKKNAPEREWDKGKEKLFPASSEDKYFEDKRSERIQEFAPPSMYYENISSGNTRKQDFPPSKPSESKLITHIISNVSKSENNSSSTSCIDREKSIPIKDKCKTLPETISNIPLPTELPRNKKQSSNYGSDSMHHESKTSDSTSLQNQTIQEGLLSHSSFVPNNETVQFNNVPAQFLPSQFSYNFPGVTAVQHDFSKPPPGFDIFNQSVSPGCLNQAPVSSYHNSCSQAIKASEIKAADPTSVSEPIRYNIIDPRFVQNQELWESESPNLRIAKKSSKD